MKRVFADTYYFLALLNTKDAQHVAVRQFSAAHSLHLVTTTWVLTEVADALCKAPYRRTCAQFLRQLRNDKESTVFEPTMLLFEQGLTLYESRTDKDWSLTDCISFTVMNTEGLTEALTGDRHFEQAGYKALLKP